MTAQDQLTSGLVTEDNPSLKRNMDDPENPQPEKKLVLESSTVPEMQSSPSLESTLTNAEAPTADDTVEKEKRLPKRKVALFMSYCGTGYQGMQVNPGAVTIEGELFKALINIGAVSKDNAVDQKKVGFMRAARTDKGVHAAGQVVNLKMIVEDPDIIEKLNANLPDQIRVWGYVKVMTSFHSKNHCDSRYYEYLMPTYVLMPPSGQADSSPLEERQIPPSTEEEMAMKRQFRISPETLDYVRNALNNYKGTHNFHNFTQGKSFKDASSKRFIMGFDCSDPKIINGCEWVSLKVHGQAFMIHQIRKMVGLIILMARTNTPLSLMEKTFEENKINIPKAPGLGLLLEKPVFSAYNRKAKDMNRDPVEFDNYQEQVEGFKQKYIYDAMVKVEEEENIFDQWIKGIDTFPEFYTYINPEGMIPESALLCNQVRPPVKQEEKQDS
ncbi:tRNA pseudouridine synthase [Basidiobolus meristosporus CBS 931.73]|uniref:tRNA pseudouridine synthase 1 n=1 Tax=Basidiobolus meristosporus CBS 931.73 TaxID=1314790 RepID=A0A1Y1YQA4_9FUNG|nr:tRNA pseudouridine synthase [Basidiobolus meristosporus CBS 931.73]|eukprot:ORX99993.1 tRNA pseudouridine synthase [Basidiobolus meristosporus CBS 931.73]